MDSLCFEIFESVRTTCRPELQSRQFLSSSSCTLLLKYVSLGAEPKGTVLFGKGLARTDLITRTCLCPSKVCSFHGVQLHFRRTRVRVCTQCSWVQIRVPCHQHRKIKEAASLKAKSPLYSSLVITNCVSNCGRWWHVLGRDVKH